MGRSGGGVWQMQPQADHGTPSLLSAVLYKHRKDHTDVMCLYHIESSFAGGSKHYSSTAIQKYRLQKDINFYHLHHIKLFSFIIIIKS